jgi:hypothetical protein
MTKKKGVPMELHLKNGQSGYLMYVEPTKKEAGDQVNFVKKWFTSAILKIVPFKISAKETVYAVYQVK